MSLFVVLFVPSAAANAGDWMFRRSYYSHDVPADKAANYPRPRSRSAYRRAVTGYGPGFAIRGGYRYNRIFMRSGRSTDLTVIREEWFDIRP